MASDKKDIARLYQEAGTIRAEIETLWNEVQATDVAIRGAVSAAFTDDLSDAERDFAVSFGQQNAEKWHQLADLSENLGRLLDEIDRMKRAAVR